MPANGAHRPFQQARNILSSWGAFALSASAGLFLSPFVVDRLGSEAYGLWTVVGSLTGSLGILDLGMRSAVVRFVSRHHATGDHEEASAAASNLQALYLIAALIAATAGLGLAWSMPRLFDVPPHLIGAGRLALALAVGTLAINLVGSVTTGVFMAMDRIDVVGLGDLCYEACRIAAVLLVLGNGGGIAHLAAIGISLTIVRQTIFNRLRRRVYPELRLSLRMPDRAKVMVILDISFFSTIIYASSTLAAQAGTLIIGATLPLALAAYYAVGATLPDYATALNRPIAQTVHPRASRLDSLGDAEGLRALILNTGRLSALILLPVVLTFIVRGKSFIQIWQGSEFRDPSGSVLQVIALGVVFAGPRHVIQAAFVGSGRHRALGFWYVGESILRILATFALVKAIGLTGAAWASLLPTLLMATVVLPNLCRTHFGIAPRDLVFSLWARPVLAMGPFLLVLIAMEKWWVPTSYAAFFAQIAVAIPAAIAGGLFLGIERSTRLKVNARLQSAVASFISNGTSRAR